MLRRRQIIAFIAVAQSILLLGHLFIYQTWIALQTAPPAAEVYGLRIALGLLSATFVSASLLAWRYSNAFVRGFYRVAAVWLGLLTYIFLAAIASWIVYGAAAAFGFAGARQNIAFTLFGAALAIGIYGVINSTRIRVRNVTVKLPNLPAAWRGRVAAFVSDVHLGHVRGYGFAKRLVALLTGLAPDIVFVGGDMYDGTKADVGRLAQPFREIVSPLGTYFVAGNHEEFSDRRQYLDAVKSSGVHVLNNEKVIVDGLQIVGVHHHESVDTEQYRSIIRCANLDPNMASILLTHAPHHLPVAAEEKIGLQLSGHTHAGQFFPFTWITKRIYGPFVYGLKRLGTLLVYTSCGVGTWGPPLRLGTSPEVVLIGFE
jgi:predicted MPP superfamily phosphohydrolase